MMAAPSSRPANVGILAMEVYVPPSFVLQSELESHDGVSSGKYTVGLGQEKLSFCCDNEDVISMSLTVVQRLLEKNGVSPSEVGRLEVGSETVVDKSKSIKSALMTLFRGNSDIEGVDCTNACYGGTAALLNSCQWVESSGWDGRFAIAVAADSAVYAEGPARPTGGAGAVAMLVGAEAALALETGLTTTHAEHVYDFYKPKLASEYPVVDGKLSQSCYIKALDRCYAGFSRKFSERFAAPFSLNRAAAVVFHAPYNKLVQKSAARLVFRDLLQNNSAPYLSEDEIKSLDPFKSLSEEASLVDRDLEKAAVKASKSLYDSKVAASAAFGQQVGNMYTASLYGGLASLVAKKGGELAGQRILLFSYGSGLVSSMFALRGIEGSGKFNLSRIAENLGVTSLLEDRIHVSPETFVKTMHRMEEIYGGAGIEPVSSKEIIRDGVFYLTNVDDLYRRYYARKGHASLNGISA